MKNLRLDQIFELIKQQGTMSVVQLSEIFNVTTKTISRDLGTLESEGKILRTRGGAKLIHGDILRDKPFELRLKIETDKKKKIGLLATHYINHGDKIFIGAGSSLHHLTAHIDNTKRLYVVTDSVTVVNQLNSRSEIMVFLIGGEVVKHIVATSGTIAEETLRDFYFDTAFVSATTMDREGNLFHRGSAEYGVYRQLSDHSKRLVALMDSSKLGKRDFINVASLKSGDLLITDSKADPEIIDHYKKMGISVEMTKSD